MTTKKTTAKTAVKKSTTKKTPVKSNTKSTDKSGDKAALKQIAKKPKKKVVRDSFTMPQNEYSKIAEIKSICLKAKMHVKKSEVLRAGLKLLAEQSAAQLKHALGSLEKIKTGRPQKH